EEVTPTLLPGTALAAVNSPTSVVISGDTDAVQAIAAHWKAQGRRTTALKVSHAFHSPHMDPILEEFRAVAAGLVHKPPRIPVISNLTGRPVQQYDADYWVRHLRDTVRFADGITTLHHTGTTTYLEIGPHPALTPLVKECTTVGEPLVLPALRPQLPEPVAVMLAAATAHVHGLPVDWTAALAGGNRTDLPTYAFERRRSWLAAPAAEDAPRSGAADAADAPLWAAVDGGDQDGFAAALGLGPEEGPEAAAALALLAAWRRRRRWTYAPRRHAVHPAGAGPAGRWAVLTGGTPGEDTRDSPDSPDSSDSSDSSDSRDVLDEPLLAALAAHGADLVRLPAGRAPGATAADSTAPDATALGVIVPLFAEVPPPAPDGGPVWVLTRGATAVGSTDPLPDEAQARRWDAALAAGHRVVDLPADGPDGARTAALLAPALTGAEEQLAVRGGGLFAVRPVRFAPAPRERPAAATGWIGAGGDPRLAAAVARRLVADGVTRLFVSGAGYEEREFAALGVPVTHLADPLSALPAELLATPPAVVRIGEDGAAALDHATLALEVAWFLSLHSPAAGRAAEAAVRRHRAQGRPATAVAWGPWTADGPAPAEALRAVWPLLGHDEPLLVVTDTVPSDGPGGTDPARAGAPEAAGAGDLPARLAAAGPGEREALLTELFVTELHAVLGHGGAGEVGPGDNLMDLGMTSFAALELIRRLKETAGLDLSPSALFDHPTAAELARHVATVPMEGTNS
ncbi:acyltransferase domain-containing protein, partial [Kitasatospora sp. NPDC056327]|uniref:acyltransferase domain-containing protein n=1 Tax=Kitasatospora sp. NPDC056327 TaxID=3345785 RepID=UPI0035E026AD